MPMSRPFPRNRRSRGIRPPRRPRQFIWLRWLPRCPPDLVPPPPRALTSPELAKVKSITWTASRTKRERLMRRPAPAEVEAVPLHGRRTRKVAAGANRDRTRARPRPMRVERAGGSSGARGRGTLRAGGGRGPWRDRVSVPGASDRCGNRRKGRAVSSRRTAACTRPTPTREQGRDRFADFGSNPVKVVAEEPVSTFSIDVDTASYGFVRASLNDGVLPQKGRGAGGGARQLLPPTTTAGPESRETPFRASVSLLPAPWNPRRPADAHRHPGLRPRHGGRSPREPSSSSSTCRGRWTSRTSSPSSSTPSSSSSAPSPPRTRSRSWSTRVRPAPCSRRPRSRSGGRILAALEHLDAGGSTAGGEGIRQAYFLAERPLRGRRDQSGDPRHRRRLQRRHHRFGRARELHRPQARERRVPLRARVSAWGNYNDELMQRLAQNGNGNAAYIDSLNEARKALVEEATSMPFPIAKDVKIQVEFNPAAVSEYRLIGYEDADARPRGLPQRPDGRGRDRLRPHRHRHLRGGAGRLGGRAGRAASLPAGGSGGDGDRVRRRGRVCQDPLQAAGRRHQYPHHPRGDHRRRVRERGRGPRGRRASRPR